MYQILHTEPGKNRSSDLQLRHTLATMWTGAAVFRMSLNRSFGPGGAEAEERCPHCSREMELAVQRMTSQNSPSFHCSCSHASSPPESLRGSFPCPIFSNSLQGKVRAKNSIFPALHEKSWWAPCCLLYVPFRQDGSRYSWTIAANKE